MQSSVRGLAWGQHGLILCAITLGTTVAAQDPYRCEDFSNQDPVSYDDAKKACIGGTENDLYGCAQVEMRKGKLDLAIAQLKAAIRRNSTPGKSKPVPGRSGKFFDYYPFYHLAQVYEEKEDWDWAYKCLKRVDDEMLLASKHKAAYEDLKDSVALNFESAEYLRLADVIEDWGPEVHVGEKQITRVNVAKSPFESDRRGSVDNATLRQDLGELRDALEALCDELDTLDGRLTNLEANWKAAWAGMSDADCTAPQAESPTRRISTCLERLATCSERERTAMDKARSWACKELRNQRERVETLEEQAQRIAARGQDGAPQVEKPPLPTWCESWQGNHEELAALIAKAKDDYASLGNVFDVAKTALTDYVDQYFGELRSRVTTARARLPSIDPGCASAVGVGATLRREVDDLRADLDPDEVGTTGGPTETTIGRVVDVLARLNTTITDEIDSMTELAGDCTDASEALQAIRDHRRDFELAPSRSTFAQVCDSGRRSNRLIGTCLGKQCDKVEPRAVASMWSLRWADQWRLALDGLGLEALDDFACVQQLRPDADRYETEGCPQNTARRQAWVQDAIAMVRRASSCLAEFRAAKTQLDVRLGELLSRLLAEAGEHAASDTDMQRIVQDLKRANRQLTEIRSVDADISADPAELSKRLEALIQEDHDVVLPETQLSEFELEKLGEALKAETCLAYRDAALRPLWLDAAKTIFEHERPVLCHTAYRELDLAFGEFLSGQLDAAIRRLSGQDGGECQGLQAMSHAALSYFLYVKSSYYDQGSEVGRLLLEQAAGEAVAASRVQQGFVLPHFIEEWSQDFTAFFRDSAGT